MCVHGVPVGLYLPVYARGGCTVRPYTTAESRVSGCTVPVIGENVLTRLDGELEFNLLGYARKSTKSVGK